MIEIVLLLIIKHNLHTDSKNVLCLLSVLTFTQQHLVAAGTPLVSCEKEKGKLVSKVNHMSHSVLLWESVTLITFY